MATTMLKVEVRLNFKSEGKHQEALKLAVEKAQELNVQLYFLTEEGCKPPQVVVTSEGSFTPIERFEIVNGEKI